MPFTTFMERCFVCILSLHFCAVIVVLTTLGSPRETQETCVGESICDPLIGVITTNMSKGPRHKRSQSIDELLLEVVLGNTMMCREVSQVDVAFIVHSSTGYYNRRQRLRKIFQNRKTFENYTVRHVFLLGQRNDVNIQNSINQEFNQHGDIVQGRFLDSYKNLTYKAVMGVKWISQNCRNVKYVIKIDDDVYTDLHNFFTHVYHPYLGDNRVLCWPVNMPYGIIRRKGKWKVPQFVFRHYQFFPVDYCSGFGVIIPGNIVPVLYKAVLTMPLLWIDDVFLYGMVRCFITGMHDLGDDLYKEENEDVSKCFKKPSTCKLIFAHLDKKQILQVWKNRQKYLKSIRNFEAIKPSRENNRKVRGK
ncbi:beta-1,3-galactosyltransferase 1-like [Haliotis asinina]|uniref:beta-1,3-galactosyltransferase 1-like n=1 Tax=Haliotis asinina TaxID=109174 RepID=UPI0035318E70